MLNVFDMRILLKVFPHFEFDKKVSGFGRECLHGPRDDADDADANHEVRPDPDDEEDFVIDHVEPEDTHALSAVSAAAHSVADVEAADLLWKELTHGIDLPDARPLFGGKAVESRRAKDGEGKRL